MLNKKSGVIGIEVLIGALIASIITGLSIQKQNVQRENKILSAQNTQITNLFSQAQDRPIIITDDVLDSFIKIRKQSRTK